MQILQWSTFAQTVRYSISREKYVILFESKLLVKTSISGQLEVKFRQSDSDQPLLLIKVGDNHCHNAWQPKVIDNLYLILILSFQISFSNIFVYSNLFFEIKMN